MARHFKGIYWFWVPGMSPKPKAKPKPNPNPKPKPKPKSIQDLILYIL
jgi:hypothetical protein